MERSATKDQYAERLNKVRQYIQKHLDQPLLLAKVAEIACMSPFHFHRLFRAHTGESLSAYVRRLRLEKAALQLVVSQDDITRIALDAGYETPAAFNKAFKQRFNMSPTSFRQHHAIVSEYLPDDTTLELIKMNAEILNIEPIEVLYVRKTGEYSKAAEAAWGGMMSFAYPNKLMKPDTKMIGVSYDSPDITAADQLRYDACITYEGNVQEKGEVGKQTLAGGRYARFLHKGSYDQLDKVYNSIFADWLPNSGEQVRDQPLFEIYLNRDPRKTKPENLRTEIYLPLQ
ncbi:MAG: AraC family transcriptional regulator [Gammaproteobacteria bacterium]|nr:AraC family transcriptional regulator [Gammaproteobacteria bacterium]